MEKLNVVITGGNAGLGLSLADRLLTEHEHIHICLACRNKGRAEAAREKLIRRHPDADVSIIMVDTSSIKSVLNAAREIKHKFSRLDIVYLNAGIMKVDSVNWSQVLAIFSSRGPKILQTGEGVLNHIDDVTDEGLQEVFATNLFGHFVLVRELLEIYGGRSSLKVVWSSSQNADAGMFNIDDIQHSNGLEPYSSSKYVTDVVSVALNERFNSKGLYSVTTCPGLVMSNMTFGILPPWCWTLVMPFLFFMRLFVSNLTCNPFNGSESLVWASKQRNEVLSPSTKYLSHVTWYGKPYTDTEQLKIPAEQVDSVYTQLEDMYQDFKQRYKDATWASKVSNGINGHIATNGVHQ